MSANEVPDTDEDLLDDLFELVPRECAVFPERVKDYLDVKELGLPFIEMVKLGVEIDDHLNEQTKADLYGPEIMKEIQLTREPPPPVHPESLGGIEGSTVLETFRESSSYVDSTYPSLVDMYRREVVIDWMMEICVSLDMRDTTFALSISIFDRYLAVFSRDKKVRNCALQPHLPSQSSSQANAKREYRYESRN